MIFKRIFIPMSKDQSKPTQQKINQELLGYIMRTDARFMAMEVTLGEILKLTPKQQEILSKRIETNFRFIYQAMIEKAEDLDPALAAGLLDGQNPYSGLFLAHSQ